MIKKDMNSMYPYRIGNHRVLGAGSLANHVIRRLNIDSKAEPPNHCPYCQDTAKNPVRDDKGHWTWDCKEGCNP